MKRFFLLAATILCLTPGIAACREPPDFGIYLADTGQLVLSGRHIQSYDTASYTLELNNAGIEKWNSFITYTTPPKLRDCLFSREFVLRIDGREVCRGKFWSRASSALCPDVAIYESLFRMDAEHRELRVEFGYLSTVPPSEENRISAALAGYFQGRGLPG